MLEEGQGQTICNLSQTFSLPTNNDNNKIKTKNQKKRPEPSHEDTVD